MTTSKLLIPLRDYIRDLRERLANCQWIGDDKQALYLQTCLDHAQALLKRGDTYLPLF